MKPHPRIRKTIKWGGAVVTVLLLVAWASSGAVYVLLGLYERCVIGFHSGEFIVDSAHWFAPFAGVDAGRYLGHGFTWPNSWLPHTGRSQYGRSIAIPLWMLVLLALSVTVAAGRLDDIARRRAKLNLCPKCNYDRTGLAIGAVCPECGAVSSSAT